MTVFELEFQEIHSGVIFRIPVMYIQKNRQRRRR
jgi:hypothetical protein